MDEKKELENNLIKNIKNKNCNESLIKLTEIYSPLCFSVYRKFMTSISNFSFSQEDIKQDQYQIVYKAAKKFDKRRKTKFSSFLANYLHYYFYNYIKNNKEYVMIENENLNLFVESSRKENIEKDIQADNVKYIYHLLGKIKDKKDQKIFKLRYDTKKRGTRTWQQIAKKVNLSAQGCINRHNKTLKLLRNKMKSNSYVDVV